MCQGRSNTDDDDDDDDVWLDVKMMMSDTLNDVYHSLHVCFSHFRGLNSSLKVSRLGEDLIFHN